jgi:hypothetical protein
MQTIKQFLVLTILLMVAACKNDENKIKKGHISIQWVNLVSKDFNFAKNWEYTEGIYKNEWAQLSCDGICPEGIEKMMDEKGKISIDSMTAFYKLVDTTHLFHSLQCDAWCYEYAGTNAINVLKNKDTIECYTQQNAATHCSLKLKLINDDCTPTIELSSIAPDGDKTYTCNGGEIKIDNIALQKDTLKAEFSFTFDHPENPKQPMFWKGKILQKINKAN